MNLWFRLLCMLFRRPWRQPVSGRVTTVVRTPAGGYRQGNPDAPVKLIEYGSRTCPTCARFAADWWISGR